MSYFKRKRERRVKLHSEKAAEWWNIWAERVAKRIYELVKIIEKEKKEKKRKEKK